MKAPAPLLMIMAGLLATVAANATPRPALDVAELTPADATMVLELREAATLRRQLTDRPIARVFQNSFATSEVVAAWHRLAQHARLTDEQLFDHWLGRQCSLIIRRSDRETEWALVTEADHAIASAVLRRLEPKRLAPRHAIPVATIPEHELLVATDGSRVLIGPTKSDRLFDDVLARMAGKPGKGSPDLSEHEAMKVLRIGHRSNMTLFMRHERPLGGWSMLAGTLDGDHVQLRHAARFENPPFDRTITELEWDISTLALFEGRALVAMIEPTDIGGGPVEAFVQARLGEPLLSESMRRNLADVRILTIGEVDVDQASHGVDPPLPSGAVAIRMKDPSQAERQLDRHLVRIAEAINDVGRGAYVVEIPPVGRFRSGNARHIDLGPAMKHFGGGFPMLRSVTLDWKTVDGPHGSYYVIATHPAHLGETVKALTSPKDGEERRGRWASCGLVDGDRVGVHLRSYSDQAGQLAVDDPRAVAELRQTLLMLSQLASGIDRLHWRLARPSEREMRLEIEIILTPPAPAESE